MWIVDLSQLITPDMPVFPGARPPELEVASTVEQNGFHEIHLTMHLHTGTHVDSPAHVLSGGRNLSDYNPDAFVGPALVLDFTGLNRPVIEASDLEGLFEPISRAEFVLLRTGWDRWWGTEKYFGRFPVLSVEAATRLAGFNLKGLGVDAISVDPVDSKDAPVHKALLSRGILIYENLTNLGCLPAGLFTLVAAPLPAKGADGAPVRALALVDQAPERTPE